MFVTEHVALMRLLYHECDRPCGLHGLDICLFGTSWSGCARVKTGKGEKGSLLVSLFVFEKHIYIYPLIVLFERNFVGGGIVGPSMYMYSRVRQAFTG